MRLTLVINSLKGGGAERVMGILASAWAQRSNAVTLLSLDSDQAPVYPLNPSIRVESLGLLARSTNPIQGLTRNFKRISVLRKAISGSDPDIVISFLDRTNILTLLATRGLGAPVIVSERSDPSGTTLPQPWSTLRRISYRWASALVCQTNATLKRFQAITRVAGYVIPNPVTIPGEFVGKAGLKSSGRRQVIALGRLVVDKGFDILLGAFARLAPRHPDWVLVIVGGGPLHDELQAQSRTLGLGQRVCLVGEVVPPFPLLCQADLFVLSSRVEGFPMGLCEAMACGLPVVSFDCPEGPGVIIRNGKDGILVPPGDVAGLATALDRLMSEPSERRRLATCAPEVISRFSLDRILGQWQALFEEVNHSRSPGP